MSDSKDEVITYKMFCCGIIMTLLGGAIAITLGINRVQPKPIVRNTIVFLISVGGALAITGPIAGIKFTNEENNRRMAELELERQRTRALNCPKVCQGCKYYYGGYINCALHPEGIQDSFCNDWECN